MRMYENLLIILAKVKAIYDLVLMILSPVIWINSYIMM